MALHEGRLAVGDRLGGNEGPARVERQRVVAPVAEYHRTEQADHRRPVRGARVAGGGHQERHHVTARFPPRALVGTLPASPDNTRRRDGASADRNARRWPGTSTAGPYAWCGDSHGTWSSPASGSVGRATPVSAVRA
ncbi:hypothetical protein E1258_14135 [Micromonospora sp. KC207]|nr:hypothetical protein E1258_14135 [Micromonospora sp. KC207]